MTKGKTMRALVTQLLAAAAEEIFGLFERSTAEHEEQLGRLKEENERIQKQLDSVLKKPPVPLQTTDVKLLAVIKQENQDIEVPFTAVLVRTEEEQEKPQSSQPLHRHTEQMETAADGDSHPENEDNTEDSSETEDSDDEDFKLKSRNQTSLKFLKKPEYSSETEDSEDDLPSDSNDVKLLAVIRDENPEESDIVEVPFTAVPVKTEYDYEEEERPQSSQLLHNRHTEHMETAEAAAWQRSYFPPLSKDNSPASSGAEAPKTEGFPPLTGLHQQRLQMHKRSPTDVDPLSCSVCGKKFSRKEHVIQHMSLHTGEKPFLTAGHARKKQYGCPFCDKTFRRKGNLKKHVAAHKGKRRFYCSVCEENFSCDSQLRKHKCAGRPSAQFNQRQSEQMETGANGGGEDSVGGHLQAEATQNIDPKMPFTCAECGKQCTSKAKLMAHMKRHTCEKPFTCPFCAKRFKHNSSLRQHMVLHTGEKKHGCSNCDQRFTWHYQLIKHKSVCKRPVKPLFQSQTKENREPAASSSTGHFQLKEEPQSPQPLYSHTEQQMETGGANGGETHLQPAVNSHTETHVQTQTVVQPVDSSATEDSEDDLPGDSKDKHLLQFGVVKHESPGETAITEKVPYTAVTVKTEEQAVDSCETEDSDDDFN